MLLQSTAQASIVPSASHGDHIPGIHPQSDLAIDSHEHDSIPTTDHPVHSLYLHNKQNPHRQKTYLPLQQPIQIHDDNPNEVEAGTIRMLSTAGYLVPVAFRFSSEICPLGTETLFMAQELASWLLISFPYQQPTSSNYTIQETIKMVKNGRQYRVTLELIIYGEIREGPFSGLMKLLVRAMEALFAEGVDFVANLKIPTLDYGVFHLYPNSWGYNYTWGSEWIWIGCWRGR